MKHIIPSQKIVLQSAYLRSFANRPARALFTLALGAGLALLAGSPAWATTYSYTGQTPGTTTVPVTGNFTNGFNNGTAFVSPTNGNNVLSFAGGTYTANDDISGVLTVGGANALNFTGSSGTVTLTESSGSSILIGTNPGSNSFINAPGGVTVNLGIDVNNNGFVVNIGNTGTVNISSVISGTGGLNVNSGSTTITGQETYTGATTLTSSNGFTIGAGGALGAGVGGGTAISENHNFTEAATGTITGNSSLTLTGGTAVLSGTNSYTGASSFSTSVTLGSASIAATLGSGASGGTAITFGTGSQFTEGTAATITGTSSITNNSTSNTQTLEGANTYTGNTTLNAGTLKLDFSQTGAPTTNIINNGFSAGTGSALVLGGGTFSLQGKGSTTNSQTVNGTTINAGGTSGIFVASGSSGTMNLVLGTITHNTGGIVNFSFPGTGSITTSSSNDASGILGPWASTGSNTSLGYVTVSGGAIGTYSGATTLAANSGINATTNYKIGVNTTTTLTTPFSGNTLQFVGSAGGAASTVAAGSNSITLNGILSANTASAGENITGTGGLNIGSNNELDIILNGAPLSIAPAIADNGSHASSLVYSAASGGNLTLGGANTYTGTTYIYGPQLTVTGSLNGGAVVNTTKLIYNTASNSSVGAISGVGTLTNSGSGTLTLSAANTYTGATAVNAGGINVTGSLANTAVTVAASASLGGTGSIAGSVSVSSNGKINLQDSAIGTLTTGSLTINTGAGTSISFDIGSGSTGNLDKIAASGVTITGTAGITINIGNVSGTPTLTNGTYSLITGTALSSSAFSQFSLAGATGGILSLDGKNLTLVNGATGALGLELMVANGSVTPADQSFNNSGAPATINIITGSSKAVTATLTNTAAAGATALNVSLADSSTGPSGHGTVSVSSPANGSTVAVGSPAAVSGTYTAGTVGTGQTWGITNTDNSAATHTASTGGTVNVYNHSAAQLNVASGNNQTIIVGGTLAGATVILDNTAATTGVSTAAPLDVSGLSNLTGGSTGSLAVGSNSSSTYTATGFNSTVGQNQTLTVGLTQGDSATVTGAAAASSSTANITYSIEGHASGSLSGTTLNLGNVHAGYASPVTSSNSITASNGSGFLANLKGSATSSGGVSLTSFSGVAAGGTSGALTATLATGQGVGSFSSQTYTYADDSTVSGASSNVGTQTVTVSGEVYSGTSTWNTNGGGSWGTLSGTGAETFGTNWGANQGSPGLDINFAGVDTATFGTVGSSPVAASTVVLNAAAPNLNSITFSSPATSYTIAQQGNGGTGNSSITLSQGVGAPLPSINVTANATAGTQTISAPVVIASNTTLNVGSKQTLNISGTISGAGGLTNAGAGATLLSSTTGNSYTGGTTFSAGNVYVTNQSGSGTGSGAIGVSGTGVLNLSHSGVNAGSVSGPITLTTGGTLYSGGVSSGTPTTGPGTGATLTSALNVNGGNLTFALSNGGTGGSFSNPLTTTSYITTSSTVSFSGSGNSITLVDLANGGLSLRMNQPYLLIAASSASMFHGLVVQMADGQLGLSNDGAQGIVLGVSDGTTDPLDYTAINFNEFGSDGVTSLPDATTADPGYNKPYLYLSGGDLEVVPEPGTWALTLGGLALLIVVQRRRNKLG